MYDLLKKTGELVNLTQFDHIQCGRTSYYRDHQGNLYKKEDIETLYTLSEIDDIASREKIILAVIPGIISAMPSQSVADNVKLAEEYATKIIGLLK